MDTTTGNVKIRKELPCTLTQEELMSYSREMAKQCQDKNKAESSLKEVKAEFNARIAKHDAEINSISQKISNGYEYRDVDCTWEYFWDGGYKVLYRNDTSAEVDRRPIEAHERQAELFEREKAEGEKKVYQLDKDKKMEREEDRKHTEGINPPPTNGSGEVIDVEITEICPDDCPDLLVMEGTNTECGKYNMLLYVDEKGDWTKCVECIEERPAPSNGEAKEEEAQV